MVTGWSYLQIWRGCEFIILEEVLSLLLGLDLKGLRFLGVSTEDSDKILVVPLLDIIIRSIHPMDHTFDCVAFVADHESGHISTGNRFISKYRSRSHMIGFKSWRIIVLSSCAVN